MEGIDCGPPRDASFFRSPYNRWQTAGAWALLLVVAAPLAGLLVLAALFGYVVSFVAGVTRNLVRSHGR